jgi:hypothetical protein
LVGGRVFFGASTIEDCARKGRWDSSKRVEDFVENGEFCEKLSPRVGGRGWRWGFGGAIIINLF